MEDLVNIPWSIVAKYPYHAEPAVQKYWKDGKHVPECTGKCEITATGGILRCASCPLSYDSLD